MTHKSKILWILILLSFLTWFCFKFFNAKNRLQKSSSTKNIALINQTQQRPTRKSVDHDESFKNIERKIDDIEARWEKYARKVFPTNTEWKKYLDLKQSCEEKKLQAYELHHQELLAKHGDKLYLSLSEDESPLEKEINNHCVTKLKEAIGEAKVQAYIELLDDFNQKLLIEDRASPVVEF